MKTTIDIADPVLEAARRLAVKRGTSVKALVELGLRKVVAESRQDSGFRLRKASFKGNGLQPGLDNVSWDRMRELAYEGRGASPKTEP